MHATHAYTYICVYMYAQVVKRFPGVKIGSYPVNGTAETVVTFEWLQGVNESLPLSLTLSLSLSATPSPSLSLPVSLSLSLPSLSLFLSLSLFVSLCMSPRVCQGVFACACVNL